MVTIITINKGTGHTFTIEWIDSGKRYKAYLFTAVHIQLLKACANDICRRAVLDNGLNKLEL